MILNIAAYLFVAIDDVDALAVRLRTQAAAAQLRGTMLVTAPVTAFLCNSLRERATAASRRGSPWAMSMAFMCVLLVVGDDAACAAIPYAGERKPLQSPGGA